MTYEYQTDGTYLGPRGKREMEQPECMMHWRTAIYKYFGSDLIPKTIIVNREDLEDYEKYLESIYPGGIIPTDGVLRYRGLAIGYSEQLKRNETTFDF